MGVDYHGLKFLVHNREVGGPLGRTLMLGRQEVHLPENVVRSLAGIEGPYEHQTYCDELLKRHFGATFVDALDNSGYEGAEIVHDLNVEIPASLLGRYDSVIDFGTLEHVFNVPVALRNCSLMLRPGGTVLHVLPGNHMCGHGFWQFSPEVFLSLYTQQRGYAESEVFVADLDDHSVTLVERGDPGKRIMPASPNRLYILARAVLGDTGFSHRNVQQSDYVVQWSRA